MVGHVERMDETVWLVLVAEVNGRHERNRPR